MDREQLESTIWRLLTAGLGHGERGIDPRTVAAILDAADAYAAGDGEDVTELRRDVLHAARPDVGGAR
jgi:hypothetical protein